MPTNEEMKIELETVINSGVKSITVGDKTITYRDQADLEKALAKLNLKTNTARPYSIASNPFYCKGL